MQKIHSFHIPVMGLGYTVDTPLKVAVWGIDSVVSVMEDTMLEHLRRYYSEKFQLPYTAIPEKEEYKREKRILSYLNLLQTLVQRQWKEVVNTKGMFDAFWKSFFAKLSLHHPLQEEYSALSSQSDEELREKKWKTLVGKLSPGSIDVNIMTKIDRDKFAKGTQRDQTNQSDACTALMAYAASDLEGGLILSAGFNPRLFSLIGQQACFFPQADGHIKKRIILKVSDFRSAQIQGKLLAKKGIYVTEFRIESGLNCGGHAFPTSGLLMGPVMQDFKNNLPALQEELFSLCKEQWDKQGLMPVKDQRIKLSVQGGVGTAEEHQLLLDAYGVDSVGWGSPFLLVPEATNVDDDTLKLLIEAKPSDYYLSNASPLGVRFNNFKPSSAGLQMIERIKKGRPGSPCVKDFLSANTEFTEKPICVASRQYQDLKIKQIKSSTLSAGEIDLAIQQVHEKECLCEGLSVGVLKKYGIQEEKRPKGVSICPGPNLQYFSGEFSLDQMIGHIYGRVNLLNKVPRPHVFENETKMYVDFFKEEYQLERIKTGKIKNEALQFGSNLLSGIQYYKDTFPQLSLSGLDDLAAEVNHAMEQIGKILS